MKSCGQSVLSDGHDFALWMPVRGGWLLTRLDDGEAPCENARAEESKLVCALFMKLRTELIHSQDYLV